MSQKTCSLAIDEVKIVDHSQEFEPELTVLVNKRYVKGSESNAAGEPVTIRGTITVSF